jgi:polysaccharide export outer membrane protein
MNAIALSGGFTYRAREDKALIVRANDPKRTKRAAKPGTLVYPGDIVEVPERFF